MTPFNLTEDQARAWTVAIAASGLLLSIYNFLKGFQRIRGAISIEQIHDGSGSLKRVVYVSNTGVVPFSIKFIRLGSWRYLNSGGGQMVYDCSLKGSEPKLLQPGAVVGFGVNEDTLFYDVVAARISREKWLSADLGHCGTLYWSWATYVATRLTQVGYECEATSPIKIKFQTEEVAIDPLDLFRGSTTAFTAKNPESEQEVEKIAACLDLTVKEQDSDRRCIWSPEVVEASRSDRTLYAYLRKHRAPILDLRFRAKLRILLGKSENRQFNSYKG